MQLSSSDWESTVGGFYVSVPITGTICREHSRLGAGVERRGFETTEI
jgi:hypothetical protein